MNSTTTDALRYAIVGTGALGGFYGGMLANAGKEVHFLFHSDYDHVCREGLRVDSVLGDFHLKSVHAYASTEAMPVCDVVLVCLKTTSDALLASLLRPLLGPHTTVVLIQNGLGNEERLSALFPGLSIAGGLGFICSSKRGPGYIQHMDYGKLTLGLHSGSLDVLERICADLEAAGVPAELSDDLRTSRWKKLVWNVPYNGLCVVMQATTQALMTHPSTQELLGEMMLEVIRAARACGVSIGDSFAQAMLESTRRMRPYAPSMKLDYDFRRPMEIEAIYSRPLEAARAAGVDMPKVAMLENQLRFIESTYR
jgi:2-dehydropantoate 2-reductase